MHIVDSARREQPSFAVDHSVSVMCIDDNALLVDALEQRLSMEPGFSVIHRVADLSAAVNGVVEHAPDIVLLDMHLEGGQDSIEILSEIVQRAPSSRVIIFTGHPTHQLAMSTLATGAWGFLSKGLGVNRLLHAIRAVASGEVIAESEEHE